MLSTLIDRSFRMTLLLGFLLCGAYPLLITLCGKFFFPQMANGGIIVLSDGKAVGAHLIGQAFTKPQYFHGRPSSAGSGKGYDASNSSGSNLGPTNRKWVDAAQANVDQLLHENPTLKRGEIPSELVTSSGSGLDPHISLKAALIQSDRVAKARGVNTSEIVALIEKHLEGPQLGILGESVINVLELNLDLDRNKRERL